ncbi:S-adenosyl-L-methionine-dependent methyltransferase [Rhizophagus irregularis]|uniref:S-adenosyl-L-methionine-dependent methyltransferase n=1 Tax=Rhizophagus irregularis TaxID=588596 RepID=A0A2I1ESQ3_9GLOM|nr:S-adenosyl-L-methionine-dependent methyltransferase [Rhizophagus irregularis]PKC60716.1 S-adenosyl-L-methionine-dependent methyltransferase [Rhizophagus irregularis]PKY25163.1 S-adenosyl-L-methionine-dependent methyltransferase [Rhizophagus irregularis]
MYRHLKPEKIYKPHDYVPLPPPNFDIFHYRRGRKYISGVNHLLPVDDSEFDRIQHQHNIYYHVWKNHFSSPIRELLKTEGTKVLDVGCGPAMWTLEMASLYPKSKFTGIDVAPIYPVEIKPLNVEFLQVNIVKHGLPYDDNTFDYVFSRFKGFSYTIKDWKFVISEICRVCKIGGYIEFMEKDVKFDIKNDFTKKELSRFVRNLRRKSIEPIISPKIEQYIRETNNFPDIHHEKRDVPTGEWGDNEYDTYKIGKSNNEIIRWGAENIKNIMIEECDYDEKEWDLTVDEFMRELDEHHIYDNIHRIFAKKETESKEEVCKRKFNFSLLRSLFSCFKKPKKFIKKYN